MRLFMMNGLLNAIINQLKPITTVAAVRFTFTAVAAEVKQ